MSQSDVATLNMQSISVKQLGDIVKMDIEAEDYDPILGIGKAGVGKTTGIREVVMSMGIGYKELRLGHLPQQDLIGMPDISVDKNGRKYTEYIPQGVLPPSVWDQAYNNGAGGWRGLTKEEGGYGEVGVLVLDEVTSCSRDVRAAAYQLLDSQRAIHEYHLPDKWKCVAIGNGPSDGGVFNGLETAFITRCMSYRIDIDADSWKTWAIQHNLNSAVISFIQLFPEKMHTMKPDLEYEEAAAVPRSWEKLSKHIDIDEARGFGSDDFIVLAHATGCVGEEVGQEFMALYHKNKNTINPRDIINGKADPKQGAMFRTTNSNTDARQVGVLTINKVIQELVSDIDKSRADKNIDIVSESANFVKWLIHITEYGSPLDLSVVGLRGLVEASSDFVSILTNDTRFDELCPEFLQFAQDNQILN